MSASVRKAEDMVGTSVVGSGFWQRKNTLCVVSFAIPYVWRFAMPYGGFKAFGLLVPVRNNMLKGVVERMIFTYNR